MSSELTGISSEVMNTMPTTSELVGIWQPGNKL